MGPRLSKILVVDDEPAHRFLLRRIFERAGHVVSDAGDGAAALRAVADSRPDLVVTDMMMPVMDGAELIRRLRCEPATAGIPILAASGDPNLAVGADAVCTKPYSWRHLVEVADALLREGRDLR
jgi:two-component system chemotaxis response regulator CheY